MGALDDFISKPTPKPSTPALDSFAATPQAKPTTTPALDAFTGFKPAAVTSPYFQPVNAPKMVSPTPVFTPTAASTPKTTPSKAAPANTPAGIAQNTFKGLPEAAHKTATYLYDSAMQIVAPGITPEEANSPKFLATSLAPELIPSVQKIGTEIIKHPIVSAAQIGQGTVSGALDFLSNAMVNYIPGLVPQAEREGTLQQLHKTFQEYLFPEGKGDLGGGFEQAGSASIPIALSGGLGEAAAPLGAGASFAAGTAGFAAAGQTQLPSDASIEERAKNVLDSLVQQGLFVAGTYGYHVAKGMIIEGAKNAYHTAAANAPSLQELQQGHVKIPGLGGEGKSEGLKPGYMSREPAKPTETKAFTSVEAKTHVKENFESLKPAYDAEIKKQYNGADNVISADAAKQIIPGYAGEHAETYHEGSSDFAKTLYAEKLPEKQGQGNNTVLFTGGGTGVGKSTALREVGLNLKDYPIVYDTNLTGDGAIRKIQAALDHGYDVDINVTHRDPHQAFESGVIPRVAKENRIVSIKEHVSRHEEYRKQGGSIPAIAAIEKHFGEALNDGRLQVTHIDNTGPRGTAKVTTLDKLPEFDYHKLNERLAETTKNAVRDGKISPSHAEGITGAKNSTNASGRTEQGSRKVGTKKVSVSTLKSIAAEKNPYEISKILEKEVPNLTPKTRDYIAASLTKMSRTGDIEGMLEAAQNAASGLKSGDVSGARRGGSPRTTQKGGDNSTSRISPDSTQQTQKPGETGTPATKLPKSIGELLTTQENSTYIDSITKSIKDKDNAALAQQEYNSLWEQADQRIIDRTNELEIMRQMLEEQVDLHPGRKLSRYASDGTLPEVTGTPFRTHPVTGKKVPNTTYGMEGDTIAEQHGLTADTAQGALTDFHKMRDQLETVKSELKDLRPRARAAKIIQGMVDEVPVIAQERAGEIDTLGNADDVRFTYKDITGFKGQARDVYRNFEAFFGDRYAEVKKAVLDPFDKAKGDMVDELNKQSDELAANVTDKFNIKRGSKKAQAIMDWGERGIVSRGEHVPGMNFEYTTQDGLIKAFGRDGAKDVTDAEQWFRKKYDSLVDEANEVRAKIYPNDPSKLIPKRKDYFRHYKEVGGDFQALRDLIESATGTHPGIDPTLAGISEFTSPKSKFLSFAKERIGQGSSRDAIAGFLDYAPAFSYMKHIDPHIGVFRYLRRVLADHAPTPGVTEVHNQGTGKVEIKQKGVNNFLEYLNDFSNDLAGKTNPADRFLQKVIPGGRVTMRVIDWTNSRVKSNQILGNLSSSVAQLFNLPQGIASAKQYMVPGMARTLSGIFTPGGPIENSSFIKERYMEPLQNKFKIDWAEHPFKGTSERGKELAAWVTQAGDEIATKMMWNAHYSKGVAEGHPNPIKYADDTTRSLVAGRGIGEVPLGLKSKWVNIVAPFQVEVANSWLVQSKWLQQKAFGNLAIFFLASYIMNAAAQKVRGSNVTFDPINSLIDGSTQAADELKSTGNVGRATFKFAGRQAGELLSNVPFGQTIAAGIPDSWVQGATGLTGAPMDKTQLFGSADPGRFGGGLLVVNSLSDPLYKLITPFGGAQIKKTKEGIQAMLKGSVNDSKGKTAYNLKPSVLNVTQAVLFGKSATAEAQKYYNDRNDLFTRTYSQDAQRTELSMDGEKTWSDIKAVSEKSGPDAGKQKLKDLALQDPVLAQKVIDIAKQEALGLTGNDRMIGMLGVENGERAKYITEQFKGLKTDDEKKAYLKDLATKKLMSSKVLQQITVILQGK